MYDLGRLLAQATFLWLRNDTPQAQRDRCVAALLDGYAAVPRCSITPQRLTWHVATALLMRAKISGLRTWPATWADDITACVAETRRTLA